jgi:hypothetical protein
LTIETTTPSIKKRRLSWEFGLTNNFQSQSIGRQIAIQNLSWPDIDRLAMRDSEWQSADLSTEIENCSSNQTPKKACGS